MVIPFVLTAVLAYLLGSLNFGVILSKAKGEDVREKGSGNAGTTNMLRNYGKGLAALTILGDMLKVVAAIYIAYCFFPVAKDIDYIPGVDNVMLLKSYTGLFCVLGHIFPCYFKFKGGKGVATSGGMVFAIDWRIALILLAVFILIVLITKYVSLGSIVMAILYPVLIFAFHRSIVLAAIASVFTLIVLIAHRENIKKLIHGTENKISFKEKKDTSD